MRHLHIENSSRSSALSHVKGEHIAAARERHPLLARDFEITIGWDGDILEQALATADFLIASRPPKERLRQRAPKLRWIQTTGAGVDHLLPLDWLPEDITLTNNSGPHGPKGEDFCTLALLALSARLPTLINQQIGRTWNPIYTVPISGKTCVVLGYGDVGQAAVRAAKKLRLEVTAITRTGRRQASGLADCILPSSRMEEVLPQTDFLIVAAPLTAETRNFISRSRLALLKPTAGVINLARAAIVDYSALCEMLRAGLLAGAVLDVHDPEPLPAESELWSTPNLILTPHISCDDPRYVDMLLDAWAANLEMLDQNQVLINIVDRRFGY